MLIFFHISVRASQINIYQTYSDTLQSRNTNIDSIARWVLNFCLCFRWRECQQARLWCKLKQISFRFWMFLEERPSCEGTHIIHLHCNKQPHVSQKDALMSMRKKKGIYLRLTSRNSKCFEHKSYRTGNNQQSSVRGLFQLHHSLWRNKWSHVPPGNCKTSFEWQILWLVSDSIYY